MSDATNKLNEVTIMKLLNKIQTNRRRRHFLKRKLRELDDPYLLTIADVVQDFEAESIQQLGAQAYVTKKGVQELRAKLEQ